jgi:hypothetical protein
MIIKITVTLILPGKEKSDSIDDSMEVIQKFLRAVQSDPDYREQYFFSHFPHSNEYKLMATNEKKRLKKN